MKEEIELELKDFDLFKTCNWPENTETVFHKKLDINIEKTPLHEGQKMQYFSKKDLFKMDLAYHDNEILKEFLTK